MNEKEKKDAPETKAQIEAKELEKRIRLEAQSFIRKADLEPYFAAIKDSQILEITETTTNKKGEVSLIYNPFWYSPAAINYMARRGFYPYLFDSLHNKLLIAINKDFPFIRAAFIASTDEGEEQYLQEDEIATLFNLNMESYEADFFSSLLPQNLSKVVKDTSNLEFKLFPKKTFEELLSYVINPNLIKEYERQRKVVDARDTGFLAEGENSVAGEMLDAILTWAVLHRGTDVHLEYTGKEYRARVRIDGDLVKYPKPIPSNYYASMINVVRTRCEIDISEQFRPQDGNMQFSCHFVEAGKVSSFYDIRVSIIPEVEGRKNAVLRIQQKGEFKRLDQLGFSPIVYREIQMLCQEPHGLILVTGPTGCGKTTTLYSILNELNKMDVKILTAEEPVEIKMEGIEQVSINEIQGRTFPNILKSFLRHDPDIILVGEIRDVETTKLAIQAANTGHLVLTTLHTNDSISSIKRLTSMEGVDPADFAFALKGVMAQRLVKTIRKDICKYLEDFPDRPEILDPKDSNFKIAKEVNELFASGKMRVIDMGEALNTVIGESFFPITNRYCYDGDPVIFEGRTALTEFWRVGIKAQDLIFDKKFSTHELTRIAIDEDGMLPMAITGVEKLAEGHTSIENVIKVVGADSVRHNKVTIRDMFFK